MAYPQVTNTFIESTTAYATAVNRNFLDIVNGISDGTKDIRINDLTVQGTLALSNALTARTLLPVTPDTYDLGSAAGAWNNVWINQASLETAGVSAAGHVWFRSIANYVNSDQSNYLDLHAGAQIRLNNPGQVNGSFVVSGALQADSLKAPIVSATTASIGDLVVTGTMSTQDISVHNIYPAVTDYYNIGSGPGLAFKNIHAYSMTVYNNIQIAGLGTKLFFADANNYISEGAAGQMNIVAAGGSGTVFLEGQTVYSGDHWPNANGTKDLGWASNRWRNLWLSDYAYLYGGAQLQGSKLLVDSNGNHYVSGTSQAINIYGLNEVCISGAASGAINIQGAPLKINSPIVTINEGAQNRDFAVNSNGNVDTLFVDGSANLVGIRKSAPSQVLDVNGNMVANGNLFHGDHVNAVALQHNSQGQFYAEQKGIASANTCLFYFVRTGRICTLHYEGGLGGVSTATTWSIPTTSWPTAAIPAGASPSDIPVCMYLPAHVTDDAAGSAAVAVAVDSNGLYLYKDDGTSYVDNAWVSTGTKQMWTKWTITYRTND